MAKQSLNPNDLHALSHQIKIWGQTLGFQQIGITDLDLSHIEPQLRAWLQKRYHGEMAYMERHAKMRTHPEQLLPGAIRVIVARIDYLNQPRSFFDTLDEPEKAYISIYAHHRDYHKLVRKKLAKLAEKITETIGPFGHRATADSAPIMEKPLANKAGIGWQGKHTNLINPKAGSWFFLGTLLVDIPLPTDPPFTTSHCGSCQACMDVCPTKAIVAPYQLDARRCISYLTIELKGSIPVEFRKAMGNRIYGCDDCQIFCPWNKFAKHTTESGFESLRGLTSPKLIDLFAWDEATFLAKTEGSAIRRIGHERWLRNIAVALGNAPSTMEVITALKTRLSHPSELVQAHVKWALAEHQA